MKKCSKCSLWLPLEAFSRNRSRRDGLKTSCPEYERAYVRQHHNTGREYYLRKARRRNAHVYAKLSALLRAFKEVPCADCGQTYPDSVMDFDHVRGVKSFTIARAIRVHTDAILGEVAKCDVVCANCHRHQTYTRLLTRP